MCGIFGIFSNRDISINKLKEVSKNISHRGPDDEGYLLINRNTNFCIPAKGEKSIELPEIVDITNLDGTYDSAFLHRRLSIIDLSAKAHQPMCFDNNSYWIIFNGEIYNYIELKQELINLGYQFRSKSDTEVILASYKEWGTECFNKFNGMWALAIYDTTNSTIILSRDRFGVKPLYYCYANDCFIFCSEIKGIIAYLGRKIALNDRLVLQFLNEGEIKVAETSETIFEGIKQLPAGSFLFYKRNNITINNYWELESHENKLNFEDNLFTFKELFKSSLEYRFRSDVEVGACLSGGIDSSSIVSFSEKLFNKKIHSFSAIWPGAVCDESYYINKVNYHCRCIPHLVMPQIDDLEKLLEKLSWYIEVPIPTSSLIAQWFVMETSKINGIKVLLDGQGADEVLGGYPRYVRSYLNEMLSTFNLKEIYRNYDDLSNFNYSLRKILGINRSIFHTRKHQVMNLKDPYTKKYKNMHPQKFSSLKEHQLYDLNTYCLPSLLQYEDRNSMAHSVESRVPYLDYRLVEFCYSIPASQKIHGAKTKVVLRESMKEYLPSEVYKRRDKIGFSTPLEAVFFGPDKMNDIFQQNLKDEYFQYILKFVDITQLTSSILFKLISLKTFLKKWA